MKKLSVLVLCLTLSGCAWIPSPLRLFGDPIQHEEKAKKKEDAARDLIYEQARESAHKTQAALSKESNPSREVQVARDFSSETVALLDQARGPAMLADLNRWQEQVDRLCSTDPEVRMKADFERSKERLENEKTSAKLNQLEARARAAEEKELEYAKIKDRQADWLLKIAWGLGILAVLWVLSQVLAIAARLNPAFAGASTVLNTVAAPAVHFAYSRAVAGVKKLGEGMATIRKEMPEVAEQVTRLIDSHLDSDHKQIAAAAAAAKS